MDCFLLVKMSGSSVWLVRLWEACSWLSRSWGWVCFVRCFGCEVPIQMDRLWIVLWVPNIVKSGVFVFGVSCAFVVRMRLLVFFVVVLVVCSGADSEDIVQSD